ncbi:MAG: SDR family oxidoreductase [Sphingobacteriia bacterium]|nr:SDR family oxidoreductase [Sphingobacteriia bacterium]
MNYLIAGSSGIGDALAHQLSDDNRVYATYYQQPKQDTFNISYHYWDAFANEMNLDFLPDSLDGLAYCVGAIQLKPFTKIQPQDLLTDYQLQLVGAFKMIQYCLPKLRMSKKASIVLFSTVAVQSGFTFHSLISASKGAVEGLTRSLAAELAPGIRVNCIAPSLTHTPLTHTLLNTQDKNNLHAQRHPLKRIGTPADIANAAAFLLSEQSSWVTGQVFHIDGGIGQLR